MRDHIRDIYKKIVEQSKKKFFFNVFSASEKPETKIEIFQLNLIIVLWYMKKKKFKQNDIIFLINIFLKDLELLCFEMGEAESRIPKKMRKMEKSSTKKEKKRHLSAFSNCLFSSVCQNDKMPRLQKKQKKNGYLPGFF